MRKRHMLSPILATRRHSGSLKVRPVIDVYFCIETSDRPLLKKKRKKTKTLLMVG